MERITLYLKFLFNTSEDVTIQVFKKAQDGDYKVAQQGNPLDLTINFPEEGDNDKKISGNDKS